MQLLTALLAGLVFGLGLILAGMTDPGKVLGFLDLAGAWDPTLACVMGGAILVGAPAFRYAGTRPTTLLGSALHLPGNRVIDHRLLLGALTFGVGWGLAGICPGPALALVASGAPQVLLFVGAMAGGMLLFELLEWRRAR